MSWQSRDKDLTREEVIKLAQQDVAPYWLNSPPLFMAHQSGSGFEIFPLDEQVLKKAWILLFVDHTTFLGESILSYVAELDRRYRAHQVGVTVVLHSPYRFSKVKRHIQHWGRLHPVSTPIVFDFDDSLKKAFRVNLESQSLVFDQGQRVFESQGSLDLPSLEQFIQGFLRKKDPGLAFFPVIQPFANLPIDLLRVEFGFSRSFGQSAQFEGVEFRELDSMTRKGESQEVSEPAPERFVLVGQWYQDWERIWTDDPLARLEFRAQGGWVSLVAQPLAGEAKDQCVIAVELSEDRVYAEVLGEHLHLSETGEALVDFSYPGVFQILKKLPVYHRALSLSFPHADHAPVALYGVRFGNLPSP